MTGYSCRHHTVTRDTPGREWCSPPRGGECPSGPNARGGRVRHQTDYLTSKAQLHWHLTSVLTTAEPAPILPHPVREGTLSSWIPYRGPFRVQPCRRGQLLKLLTVKSDLIRGGEESTPGSECVVAIGPKLDIEAPDVGVLLDEMEKLVSQYVGVCPFFSPGPPQKHSRRRPSRR